MTTDLSRTADSRALVAALADPAQRSAAFAALLALGPAARASVRAGLGDGRWEVRRWCVYWHLRFPDAGDASVLAPLARDPRSRVRHGALVALVHARGAAGADDVTALVIERALADESLHVRRQAVLLLAWHLAHPDLEALFADLLASERDAKLRKFAGIGLVRCRTRATQRATETKPC